MINIAAPHFGNPIPSFSTLFRSYSAAAAALGLRNASHLENLIHKRCKSGTLKLDEALGLFHYSYLIHAICLGIHLIGALSKMNHCSTVISMFREMMRYVDFCPDVSTMNTVIKCYYRLNKVDLGFCVLAITLKRGVQPDGFTVSTLLHGLCWERETVDDSVEFFKRIVKMGDPYNHITYATIIAALCKTPNTLNNLCKETHVDMALELFQDMVNQGVQPDVATYTALFHGLCKSGRVEEAKKFFYDMIDRGISPDVYSYTALIDSLCKERRTKEALSLLDLMIQMV